MELREPRRSLSSAQCTTLSAGGANTSHAGEKKTVDPRCPQTARAARRLRGKRESIRQPDDGRSTVPLPLTGRHAGWSMVVHHDHYRGGWGNRSRVADRRASQNADATRDRLVGIPNAMPRGDGQVAAASEQRGVLREHEPKGAEHARERRTGTNRPVFGNRPKPSRSASVAVFVVCQPTAFSASQLSRPVSTRIRR